MEDKSRDINELIDVLTKEANNGRLEIINVITQADVDTLEYESGFGSILENRIKGQYITIKLYRKNEE